MVRQKPSSKIRIALDAMGGDHSPEEIVKGGVAATEDDEIEVVLVGPESVVRGELEKYGSTNSRISIVHASEVVAMDERPVSAIKEKRDSSIVVGVELLKKGEVASFVSAGNTGAVMTAACLIVGRKRGLARPALGAVFPFHTGPLLCLDLGANSDCKPTSLVQFANMGSIYMEKLFGIDRPRVGLLSSGEEDTKGTQLVQKAHRMLKKAKINFIGNVEGRDIASGRADVIVTDGFTGNVLVKLGEGLGEMLLDSLRKAVAGNAKFKEAADLLEPTFRSVIGTLDYREYGGALLFGVNESVIVAHGRSEAEAIKSAVIAAKRTVEQGVVEALRG
ncbi:MAG: phosphate acyltransferase PlsX [Dehalococcoidia bacterium]